MFERFQPQECDTNQEVCCTLKPEDQAGAGSSSGGIFGAGNLNVPQQSDLSTGEIGNAGGSSIDAVAEGNGYLPPIGGSPSDQVPQFTDFPQEPEQDKTGENFRETDFHYVEMRRNSFLFLFLFGKAHYQNAEFLSKFGRF